MFYFTKKFYGNYFMQINFQKLLFLRPYFHYMSRDVAKLEKLIYSKKTKLEAYLIVLCEVILKV